MVKILKKKMTDQESVLNLNTKINGNNFIRQTSA